MDNKTSSTQVTLAGRVIQGGIRVAAGSYFNTIFGFLANLYITRQLLQQEDFGAYALAFFFFSLFNLRPKAGIGYAFVQRKETTGKLIGTHLVLDASLGILSLFLLILAAPILLTFGYSQRVVWVMIALGVSGLFDSITATANGLLDKELHLGRTTLVSSLSFPLSYLPAFWLAQHQGGAWSLFAQVLTYAILLCLGMWWSASKHVHELLHLKWSFDKQTAKELIRFGIKVGMATLAGVLISQYDNYLIGTIAGEETLGYYDRAYRIAQWPSIYISSILTRVTFYAYIQLQDDLVRLRKIVTMTLWLITTLALPLALAIFVSAPSLIEWIYTAKWLPSAVFLRFLIMYSLLRPLLDNAGMMFIAIGKPQKATIIAFYQVGALIVIATPLTLLYGPIGTCVGVGAAFITGLVFAYYQIFRVIALPIKENIFPPLIVSAVTLLLFGVMTHYLPLDHLQPMFETLLKSGLTVGIFSGIMLLVQRKVFIERVRYVLNLMRKGNAL